MSFASLYVASGFAVGLLVGPTTLTPEIHITFDRPMTIIETSDGAHRFVEKIELAKPVTPH